MVPIAMMLANTMMASKTARISLIEVTSQLLHLESQQSCNVGSIVSMDSRYPAIVDRGTRKDPS